MAWGGAGLRDFMNPPRDGRVPESDAESRRKKNASYCRFQVLGAGRGSDIFVMISVCGSGRVGSSKL